ncbi:MAG TPA: LysM peptidoglycan-binding domain-containing protein [Anaerolineales bacterium]
MNSIRQLGSGLLYAVVSVVLVVGGLSLALAEGRGNPTPPPKPTSTLLLPSSTAMEVIPSSTVTPLVVMPGPLATVTPFATLQAKIVTATPARPLATASTQPRPTSTHVYYPTHFDCGPYAGWLKNYVVKPGDTLFHIATLYQTTVTALQVANCKLNFNIYPGDVLWVPNVPTITPGVTVIPTFPPASATPTLPLPPSPDYTGTAVPTLPLTATP